MVDGKTAFGRRGFLRRTAMVVGGFVVGVMGAEPAMAGTVKFACCNLCYHPSACQWTGCKAVLNWLCWRAGLEGDEIWGCYECYSNADFNRLPDWACEGLSCNSALCSAAYCFAGCGPPSPC